MSARISRAFSRSVINSPSLWTVTVIAIIVTIAFGTFFYLQELNEAEMRRTLLEEARQSQLDDTRTLSTHISSDIDRIIKSLQLLSSQPTIQRGDFTSERADELLQKAHENVVSTSGLRYIVIVDENNEIVNTSLKSADNPLMGLDRSEIEYVIETRQRLEPYVSSGFTGALGNYVVAIAVPIIDEQTGRYRGLAVTTFETLEFIEQYGNVLEFDIRSIVALDRDGYVLSSFLTETIGKYDFSPEVHRLIGTSEVRDNVYRNVLAGKADSAVFTADLGERLITGHPVFVDGEQIMSVVLSTPTSSIYSSVDERMAISRLEVTILIGAIMLAIVALVVLILRWNRTLSRQVAATTSELRMSNESLQVSNIQQLAANRLLTEANEQLQVNDKVQREFINIAAHELRTPVQPLLGVADMLEINMKDADKIEVSRPEIEMIIRNAQRLERLSSDILQVSRIESSSLTMNKETIDLNQTIHNDVQDSKRLIPSGKQVQLIGEPFKEPVYVSADRARLFDVLENLVHNAIKFTDSGTITVRVDKEDGNALVSVRDTGSGIDPEIMPRLFTKFASKSEQGTGLGLYISKSIIEAHGGRIWGENNSHGGATFTFTVPLVGHAKWKENQTNAS